MTFNQTMSNLNQGPNVGDMLAEIFGNKDLIDGIFYFADRLVDFELEEERKREEARSDKDLLNNALALYKQGRINRNQFLDICRTLVESNQQKQVHQDVEVENLLEEIERRKQ